jgi:hypothetical protein
LEASGITEMVISLCILFPHDFKDSAIFIINFHTATDSREGARCAN